MIYIAVFILSLIFTSLASSSKNKFSLFLFSFFALAPPVILAALRSPEVGTDTTNYLMFFERAVGVSSFSYYVYICPDVEWGYLFVTFLCAKLSSFSYVYQAMIHFLIIVPIFITAIQNRKWVNPTFCMFVFYCLFFNESLNIQRQYVSLSFVILAVTCLFEKRNVLFWICLALAFSFHTTTIIAVAFFFIYKVVEKYSLKQNYNYYLIGVVVVSLVFYFGNWLSLGGSLGSERYSIYLSSDEQSKISYSTLIVYFVVFFFVFLKAVKSNDSKLDFFAVIALFSITSLFLSVSSHTFYRLSLFFSVFSIISVPSICYYKKRHVVQYKSYNNVVKVMFIILFIYYWYFAIVLRGSNQTVPYTTLIQML